MTKILIIHSSVDGHTMHICERIRSYRKDLDIDIISLPKTKNISLNKYEMIIIGASIRYGKYRKELFEFIDENINIIHSKKNAFFSVNVVARKTEKNSADTNPYIEKFLLKTSWKPKIIDVFAGKIEYPKYKFLDKYAIKFIMWITKGPTNTSETYEFTDWEKVKAFAESLKS